MRTAEDFAQFMAEFQEDRALAPEAWNDAALERFLHAMAGWAADPSSGLRRVARLLIAARGYDSAR
ncbi:MAG TPA: hypothetical protein VNS09_10860 [Solirubrobacter sp.]|nr:hypothetical protein [Solirubrobacter sp.]